MAAKKKNRSEAMRGNQNARQGIDKKPSYETLRRENELLNELVESMHEIIGEIRSLVA